jgi:O-antigen ligase
MSGETTNPIAGVVRPSWRDPAAWARTADVMAILTAAALPWSTSLVAIFFVIFFVVLIPSGNVREFVRSLRRPVNLLPIVFFALAVLGTLWATDISWSARLQGISPLAKLLAIPFLVYHFERSQRGVWVFITFLVSCFLLMIMSWVVAYAPSLSIKKGNYGIPVKNYIDQSQEFALCAVALAWPVLDQVRRRSYQRAALLAAVALAFVANMMFINVARTAFVYLPVMLLTFAVLHLKLREIVLLGIAGAVAVGVAWSASPNLRTKVGTIFTEVDEYRDTANQITSAGQRLEFWTKSIKFVKEAPIAGHGTGSTKTLFVRDAIGQTGLAAEVVDNPHNQTLNVAVQWGLIGVLILYAMWIVHGAQFLGPGLVPWLGLLVVVQNLISSLFNSHLFDFHEGWMYVLGVGIAAGMVAKQKNNGAL